MFSSWADMKAEFARRSAESLAIEGRIALTRHNQRQALARTNHYDPNQPRVPAGHHAGGQWTSGNQPLRIASADRPRLGAGAIAVIALQMAARAIEAYRSDKGLWDLFGERVGVVTVTTVGGKQIFGSNSTSPTYARADRVSADAVRSILIDKYPVTFKGERPGEKPNDAFYHAEATVLLRAAVANGGTLTGQTLEVYSDRPMCNSCRAALPYLGLELGNPTVTFIDSAGVRQTMQNGVWMKW
jgi:hypothetical protein